MITDAFLTWLAGCINTLMNALPTWNMQVGYCNVPPPEPAAWDNYYTCATLDTIAAYDHFLPIHDGIFPILFFVLAASAGYLAIKGVMLIINVIRGSGA